MAKVSATFTKGKGTRGGPVGKGRPSKPAGQHIGGGPGPDPAKSGGSQPKIKFGMK
jgi:hypothetical protein